MKRLINTTTALSLALYMVPPFAAQAQDLQSVTVGDKQVICLPDKKTACPEGALCTIAKTPEACQTNAEKLVTKEAAKEQAAADKAAGAAADKAAVDQAAAAKAAATQTEKDQAAADKAAADKVAVDQAAAAKAAAKQAEKEQAAADKAAADKAAEDQAAAAKATAKQAEKEQAAADKAAADKSAADKSAADKAAGDKAAADKSAGDKAAADKAAADKAAGDKTAADKTAADKAAADKAAGDKAAADQAAADKAAADKAAADKAAADKAAADKAAGDKAAADQAATDKAAGDQANADQVAAAKAANDKAAAQDAAAIAAAQKEQKKAEAAALLDPSMKPVEALVPDQQAVDTLATVLAAPTAKGKKAEKEHSPLIVPSAAADKTDLTTAPSPDQPAPKDAVVTTETVTKDDTRSSAQDFAVAPVAVAPGKKSGLSDLEKVGLVALGALVIGAMINNNRQQVVSNTGDRVVVRQDDGTYQVYKDDNALLRQPGSKVTTQTFKDGSTRTIVVREDGSQITTVRDASGRVLQRVSYDTKGRATVLIDDLQRETPIDVTTLPRPRPTQTTITIDGNDAGMRAALASADAEDVGRKFSLRQIRTIAEVRDLAPTINVTPITFETGSAAIQPTEAKKLNSLGKFVLDLIHRNPGEVFLIEGHTDAVGSAASNLALSDRRAESVAKALSEYFGVPPENLVVQGYGESELLIDTQGTERTNRRVAVRIITPLLQQAVN